LKISKETVTVDVNP